MVSVYLFVPNLIGYTRAVLGIAAFYYVDSNPSLFCLLYFLSYVLDATDGVAARHLNQCTKFGSVLDMICDRFCTTSLYIALTCIYPQKRYFYTLMSILEIVSHWMQMYVESNSGKSHKSMGDKEFWLLRFYYVVPYSLFFVCLFNETWIVSEYMVYYIAKGVIHPILSGFWKWCNVLLAPVFVFKQVVSIVALVDSSIKVVASDEESRLEKTDKKKK